MQYMQLQLHSESKSCFLFFQKSGGSAKGVDKKKGRSFDKKKEEWIFFTESSRLPEYETEHR
jgi:hypothetical protein